MPLRVRDLTVVRNAHTVLENLSFELADGSIAGLFGPSGCGKTTLALALLNLIPRAKGEIAGPRAALIFQDSLLALNPVMRIRDQIAEVARAHHNRTSAADLLRKAGLDPAPRLLNAYPHQISGGERQRVTIAQALAADPALLIADEPFTALDAPRVLELAAVFQNLKTGLLLISHSPGILAHMAQTVLIMDHGRIVDRGAPAEVFAQLPKAIARERDTPHDTPVLIVRNLSHIAVKNVSFTVARGSTLVIVGRSGAGKSTLARCIAGFDKPTAGEIEFEGSRPQMILQQPAASLNPRFTAAEIIEEPLVIQGASKRDRRERALELLDLVGLPRTSANRRATQFSGGERQRLAIARALAPQPEILVLDESFTGLDLTVQIQIANLLRDLQERLHLTFVVISHDVEFVASMADEIAVMDQGAIVEYGPASQVLVSPRHPCTRELVAAGRALSFGGRSA